MYVVPHILLLPWQSRGLFWNSTTRTQVPATRVLPRAFCENKLTTGTLLL